jgi:hypothetical protein
MSQIQETAGHLANRFIGTGSAVTVVGALAEIDWGLWIGIAIGVAGLAMNFYYKRKSDKRSAESHRLYMSKHAYATSDATEPPIEEVVQEEAFFEQCRKEEAAAKIEKAHQRDCS